MTLRRRWHAVLEQSLNQMEQHYSSRSRCSPRPDAVGEKPRDPAIPPPELAAWTMVVSEVLNLDETLNK